MTSYVISFGPEGKGFGDVKYGAISGLVFGTCGILVVQVLAVEGHWRPCTSSRSNPQSFQGPP